MDIVTSFPSDKGWRLCSKRVTTSEMGITNGIDIFQSSSGEAISCTCAHLHLSSSQCPRFPAAARPPNERPE